MGSELVIEVKIEGDLPLTVIYSLNADRDLQEEAVIDRRGDSRDYRLWPNGSDSAAGDDCNAGRDNTLPFASAERTGGTSYPTFIVTSSIADGCAASAVY